MVRLSFMFIALLTAGCVSLDPHYDRPAAPVPATLPGAHGESTAVVGDWQKVVNDARLKKVVSIALNSNRDVQKALADIEAARARYGETRASLFPTVDAELSHTRSKTVASGLAPLHRPTARSPASNWTCSARTRACRARRAKPGLPANSPRRIPG